MPQPPAPPAPAAPVLLRARGLVQGVGFRPTVWRIARDHGLRGDVRNDGEGVLIRLWASAEALLRFQAALHAQCPPLARIDGIELATGEPAPAPADFAIVPSASTRVQTGVVPDAATCPACAAEVMDPANRRHRYPFTNCTHCGPRLSILRAIPYDRANTSMAGFPLCPACGAEYADPGDRRFHAQPNACPVCGPRIWLTDADGATLVGDPITTASQWLAAGRIVAIKGIGGFHLACDACNADAVATLRARKRRYGKPFALMARDLAVLRRYAAPGDGEAQLLASPAAPIVLLQRRPDPAAPDIAPAVAPGQDHLGWMLPYSPLHLLLLADWERPLVMTSGNRSDEPQCTDNDEAGERLAGIADAWLLHDRPIVNRVDDSVARVSAGAVRWLRRARGAAPAPLPLPAGLADLPPVLALGGELKNTICLLQTGQAILSQHLGDLTEARTLREFARTIALYRDLYQHTPTAIAVDLHPGYHATLVGRELAGQLDLPLIPVQHHAAHLGAVLADQGWPDDDRPVVGLILDGLGLGSDGTIWGGECLVGNYRGWRRAGHLRAAPLPGGERASREPWRNLYAQLCMAFGWPVVTARWAGLAPVRALAAKPLGVLARMLETGTGTPLTSSAGRLFDAVAAAVGICFDGIHYEGQAAMELEAQARRAGSQAGYPFGLDGDPLVLDPGPMWAALLEDLARGAEAPVIAARFHAGLADALVTLAARIATGVGTQTVALSGGVWQNRTLFEAVLTQLPAMGLTALTHTRVPSNDGGLALGQAVIAAKAVSMGE